MQLDLLFLLLTMSLVPELVAIENFPLHNTYCMLSTERRGNQQFYVGFSQRSIILKHTIHIHMYGFWWRHFFRHFNSLGDQKMCGFCSCHSCCAFQHFFYAFAQYNQRNIQPSWGWFTNVNYSVCKGKYNLQENFFPQTLVNVVKLYQLPSSKHVQAEIILFKLHMTFNHIYKALWKIPLQNNLQFAFSKSTPMIPTN